jgi:TRAP-type C4-dicarboxylate transport system substrate-binding protein
MFVVMNLKKWNALPADVKNVIDAVSAEWVDVHGKAWESTDKAGRDFTLSLGNKIIPLSDEESARWRNAVEPVINNYISKTPNGDSYVKKVKELISKYSK